MFLFKTNSNKLTAILTATTIGSSAGCVYLKQRNKMLYNSVYDTVYNIEIVKDRIKKNNEQKKEKMDLLYKEKNNTITDLNWNIELYEYYNYLNSKYYKSNEQYDSDQHDPDRETLNEYLFYSQPADSYNRLKKNEITSDEFYDILKIFHDKLEICELKPNKMEIKRLLSKYN